MDSFFGIGFPELVMILILAGLVLGPQKIRQVALQLGRFVAYVQTISRQFTRQLNAELDAMDSQEVRDAMQDMRELKRELADLKREIGSLPDEVVRENRRALEEGERIFQGREVPPPQTPDPAPAKKKDAGTPPAPSSEISSPPIPKPVPVPDDPES